MTSPRMTIMTHSEGCGVDLRLWAQLPAADGRVLRSARALSEFPGQLRPGSSRADPGQQQGRTRRAEGRGRNGVVIIAPSEHEKAATGGRGARLRTGLVPPLPGSIGALLVDAIDVADTATDAEVARCLAEWTAGARLSTQRPTTSLRYRDTS